MASTQTSTPGNRQVQQALRRGAKAALVAGGIQPSTRRGNKELTLAVQRLAQQPYSTLEEATQAGAALGQKIVEISQAKGLTDLDGGIVRQLMLTGDIPTVTKATAKPAKTTPVSVVAPQAPASVPTSVAAAESEVDEAKPAEAKAEAIAADEPVEIEAADFIEAEADAIAASEPAGADTKASEAATAKVEADPELRAVGAAQ
ncbi:hypothetical protein IQ265_01085 [Nodosilinea sp. LEGE 06152]|uniref:hypothetical protein n=1 Tax=Nodosilinea sp. LEGE 06152 TaxID=2777966 RepID=UPI00187F0445|nr:hypothetical protein [Nodosilinea sp. LEGE 06152]MBE9155440.1 hypothetical protein [Nodosilinea sp. LEGE 06152]